MHCIPTLFCFGCAFQFFTEANRLSLNGADWILLQDAGNLTVKGQVPGSVHTDLLRAGVIGDPYYRFNDVAYSWIGYSDWNYIKTFSDDMQGHLPAVKGLVPIAGRKIEESKKFDDITFELQQHHLLFGGLDTVAVVLLNNITLGNTFNMFRQYDFDVTGVLKRGLNTLHVRFMSPVMFARRQARQYPYDVPPDCPPVQQKGECHFNFIRKEASSFSWDWGPSFPTIGIWKNVSLDSYNTAAIRYITTETLQVNASSWELKVVVFFDGRANGSLGVSIAELGVYHEQSAVTSSADYVEILVYVSQVMLWWPNGHGKPILYTTVVSYEGSSGDTDLRTMKIGFRTVELVQDMISSGTTFYLKINGVPIFAKGSNWIPADSFQERIKQSYVRQLLQSAIEANMNILRVWGGGVYESEEFYQLADELGIMIWQDFMFACALYPTDSDFIANVQEEIIHQVRRLKRHPSIVIWSGNNENEGALANSWFNIKSADYPRFYADYIKLYVVTVGSVVSREDSSRPFVTSSPSNGVETIAEGWVAKDPQSPYYGDVHDYNYTRDSWDWQQYVVPRFASEFGLQSWCSLETLAPVSFPDADWNVDSSFVEHRQHHVNGESQMADEIAAHLKLPNSRNETKYFADFVYLTQVNQAMGIKTEVELYRRSQSSLINGSGLTMGALYWQLNDIWQAPTWASIEYGGKWKMLHYFAKKFFNHQLISPFIDGDNVTVYYVDDSRVSSRYQRNIPSASSVYASRDHEVGAKFPPGSSRLNLADDVRQFVDVQPEVPSGKSAVILGKCYKWNSFEPQYEWNVTFPESDVASQQVFTKPLSSLLSNCKCQSDCFLHFSHPTSSVPESFLLLSNLSSVRLERSITKIFDVRRIDGRTVEIHLVSSAISLFVWLDCPGFAGRFSDNGFLISRPEIVITYHLWSELKDMDLFRSRLTVYSLSDVYE